MSDQEQQPFEGWAVVELLGHVRMGCHVKEVQIAGAGFLRCDIPGTGDQVTTQYVPPHTIYRITPTTEELARAVAAHNQPQPVHRWELPAARPPVRDGDRDDDDGFDDDREPIAPGDYHYYERRGE